MFRIVATGIIALMVTATAIGQRKQPLLPDPTNAANWTEKECQTILARSIGKPQVVYARWATRSLGLALDRLTQISERREAPPKDNFRQTESYVLLISPNQLVASLLGIRTSLNFEDQVRRWKDQTNSIFLQRKNDPKLFVRVVESRLLEDHSGVFHSNSVLLLRFSKMAESGTALIDSLDQEIELSLPGTSVIFKLNDLPVLSTDDL